MVAGSMISKGRMLTWIIWRSFLAALAAGSLVGALVGFFQAPTSVIEWSQETGITWIGGVLAVLFLLHLLASWAKKKGWIYYRRGGGKGTGVAFSNALAEFEALLNPAAEHRIVEEQSQEILRSEIGQGLDDEEDDDEARSD